MTDTFELKAETRTHLGKGNSRRIRNANLVPGVVYGGEKNPTSIAIEHNMLAHALENESFYSHILTLYVDNKPEKVVLKDLQRHPNKPKYLHADFLRVNAKTKLTMHVPLHFTNEDVAPGVKEHSGVITHHMGELEVRCLPADLPEFITVDIAKLNIDESIHLSEVKIPKGVEIVALLHGEGADQPVVSIHKPHIAAEPEAVVEEEVAAEGAETVTESEEKSTNE